MTVSLEWIFGTLIGLAIAAIGYLANRQSGLDRRIDERVAALEAKLDEIKRDYVRRDDLDGQIANIDKNLDEVKDDVKEMAKMLTTILLSVGKG